MKGNDKLIGVLNQLLADELTAISQYMVHSEMCADWGYDKLHEVIEGRAIDEMHHAEWLIRRVIFLEGAPVVTKLNPIQIGKSVPEMVTTDQGSEIDAVHAYNAAIRLAQEVDDQASVDLLRKILPDGRRSRRLGRAAERSDRADGAGELSRQSNHRRSRLDPNLGEE